MRQGEHAPIARGVRGARRGSVDAGNRQARRREGADKYFELHGIKVKHENTVYELPDEVYGQGLPINNSVSALLVHAVLLGYTDIALVGCPMNARDEYIQERPALAFVVGYMAAKGIRLSWDGMVENLDYGKKRQ